MELYTIKIELYGAFRNFDDGNEIVLHLPNGANLAAIKSAFVTALQNRYPDFDIEALVAVSAFADDCAIIGSGFAVMKDTKLAILPPVNGG